jgi:hypothetical protein
MELNGKSHLVRVAIVLYIVAFAVPPQSSAYSVLTHQAIIDFAWDDSIRPLLLSRFPNTTEEQLLVAHAYAYGGCAIQDMGYYPFGKTFFSDLTHYVRSGDFVASLFRNARDVNELAFAAGALSHYVGDSFGHSIAVNHATAIDFPKLQHRYGDVVTYEDDPHAHVRTEFGFDIEQVSKRRFAPHAYLQYVGLRVPRRLLEKAFFETYGLSLHDMLGNERPAIRGYRSAVRSFIPFFARGEVVLHRNQFLADVSSPDYETYAKELAHADFRKLWSNAYRGPGFQGHLAAFIIRIVPKIGPAALLGIKVPRPETQQLYIHSINQTIARLRKRLNDAQTAALDQFALADRDLDTGAKVRPGGYARTDQTYAKLLHQVVARPQMTIPRGLREDVLAYYADPNAPITTKRDKHKWAQVQEELEKFKAMRAGTKLVIPREED